LYYIFDAIEIIADIIKNMSKEIVKKNIILDRTEITLFESVYNFMELIFELITQFDIEKIKILEQKDNEIRQEFEFLKEKKMKNPMLLANLINLYNTTFEIKSAVITLGLSKK